MFSEDGWSSEDRMFQWVLQKFRSMRESAEIAGFLTIGAMPTRKAPPLHGIELCQVSLAFLIISDRCSNVVFFRSEHCFNLWRKSECSLSMNAPMAFSPFAQMQANKHRLLSFDRRLADTSETQC